MPEPPEHDPRAALRVPVFLSGAQRAVIAALSDEEIAVLASVQHRLAQIAPDADVEAHIMGAAIW